MLSKQIHLIDYISIFNSRHLFDKIIFDKPYMHYLIFILWDFLWKLT